MRAQRAQQRTLVVHDQDAAHDARSSVDCCCCNRETDHHRDAAARRVLDGQARRRPRRRIPSRPRDPRPTPVSLVGVAQALERLEDALSLRERDPAAPVDDAQVDPTGHDGTPRPGPACRRPECRTALSTTFATARSSSAGSTSTSGNDSGTSTTTSPRRVAQARERGRHDLVEPDGARLESSSAPDCSRLMSSRFSTSLLSRSASASMLRMKSSVSARDQSTSGLQPAARQRLDRRERRAQVVAHGREQRVAQVVRVRERLRPCSLRPRGGCIARIASRYESSAATSRCSSARSGGPVITSTWPSRSSKCSPSAGVVIGGSPDAASTTQPSPPGASSATDRRRRVRVDLLDDDLRRVRLARAGRRAPTPRRPRCASAAPRRAGCAACSTATATTQAVTSERARGTPRRCRSRSRTTGTAGSGTSRRRGPRPSRSRPPGGGPPIAATTTTTPRKMRRPALDVNRAGVVRIERRVARDQRAEHEHRDRGDDERGNEPVAGGYAEAIGSRRRRDVDSRRRRRSR